MASYDAYTVSVYILYIYQSNNQQVTMGQCNEDTIMINTHCKNTGGNISLLLVDLNYIMLKEHVSLYYFMLYSCNNKSRVPDYYWWI